MRIVLLEWEALLYGFDFATEPANSGSKTVDASLNSLVMNQSRRYEENWRS